MVVVGVWPKTRTAPAQNLIRSAELVNKLYLFCVEDDFNSLKPTSDTACKSELELEICYDLVNIIYF